MRACRPCCRRATCAAAIRSAAAGQFDKAEKIITDNRVLFHRVANTLNYLDIKTVVVSCGTCYDQLQGYEFDKIFPGCRIIDIHEYLLEKGITLAARGQGGYLYHDPCHSPMKLQDPMKTVKALVGDNVRKSERCCGESGTLGVTRPDIATQVRFRKEEELRKDEAALRASRRRRREGQHQDPHQLPELPAGPDAATATTCKTACSKPTTSWSRWPTRSSATNWMPDYVHAANQRRHRTGAGVMALHVARLPAVRRRRRRAWSSRAPKLRVIRARRSRLSRLLPAWSGRDHVAEFSDLAPADRALCMEAVAHGGAVRCATHLAPAKVNLAALGNMVPHLHWHVDRALRLGQPLSRARVGRGPAPARSAARAGRSQINCRRWKREMIRASGDKEFLMAGLQTGAPTPQSITVHGQSRVLEVGFSDGASSASRSS